jgi:hypothetical protein
MLIVRSTPMSLRVNSNSVTSTFVMTGDFLDMLTLPPGIVVAVMGT